MYRYQDLPCQRTWRLIYLGWSTSTECQFGSERVGSFPYLKLCSLFWEIFCIFINIMWENKWDRNLERFCVKYLVACIPPVLLDAALVLEMTSSWNKSADIPGGDIHGFDHLLLNCLHFLRNVLQKERQCLPAVSKEDWASVLPNCYPSSLKSTDAISRYIQWKNSDMVLVIWVYIYY